MKIKFIERIKKFIEKIKIKKLPDGELEKQVNEMIENDETDSLGMYLKNFDNPENQKDMVKNVLEAENISTATKKDIIDNLPHSTKKELFKQSIKTKEIIAQKDMSTFLNIIIKDKNLNPYNELYYRLDKAFSDSQLEFALEWIGNQRKEDYDEEKILAIVGKQIAVNMKKFESFLPSHLDGLTRNIKIDDRDFDILEEKDKNMLHTAICEEAEILKEKILKKSSKKQLTDDEEKEIARLDNKNIEIQIENMVKFAEIRRDELIKQGLELGNI